MRETPSTVPVTSRPSTARVEIKPTGVSRNSAISWSVNAAWSRVAIATDRIRLANGNTMARTNRRTETNTTTKGHRNVQALPKLATRSEAATLSFMYSVSRNVWRQNRRLRSRAEDCRNIRMETSTTSPHIQANPTSDRSWSHNRSCCCSQFCFAFWKASHRCVFHSRSFAAAYTRLHSQKTSRQPPISPDSIVDINR